MTIRDAVMASAEALAERLATLVEEIREEARDEGAQGERHRQGSSLDESLRLTRLALSRGDHEAIISQVRSALEVAESAKAREAHLRGEYEKHRRRAAHLQRQVQAIEDVVRWALGEVGVFPGREPGDDLYWWRGELRRRLIATQKLGDAEAPPVEPAIRGRG